ncbi:hypothetical protein LGL88_12175 [Yersinia ruckeri]|uniref:hypothetical protein n=1 Tax=Yersinia ruckeri TaxID=29486 RepID=UPI001F43CDE6|nr:hypothetical protein [Yersinia ruckeri]EKN4704218.1 hypothetical protein [Yersinia ruckeri]UIN06499.1 hypothetical protein LGL88_12175 [Yersinia ruckeri]
MMDITKSREEFETWFKREIIEMPDFEFNTFDDVTDEYVVTEDGNIIDLYLQVQAMYMAWRASRESVDIKLPELFEDDRHAVTDAIRAAGIRIKGESE